MDNASVSYFLGQYESAVLSTLDTMRQDNIIARIWAGDHKVWKPEPDDITDRLGWLEAPLETLEKISYVRTVLEPIVNSGLKDVVLLGIGGSSLAAEVFSEIFGRRAGYPQLRILDTTDPALISKVTQSLELKKALFLVSSKSGTTIEIISLFQYFYNLTHKNIGSAADRHFIFITDKGSPMEELANKLSLQPVFLNNSYIGGRYSALSLPGIVPAAIIGIDIERLLQNAIAAEQREKTELFSSKLDATGSVLGAVLGTLAKIGRNKLTFILPLRWISFGNWLEQLIAESTGKEGKGILPIIDEPLRNAISYKQDRLFVIFQDKQNRHSHKTTSLVEAGHPVITIDLNDSYDLGGQMFFWEMATAVAGHLLGINPFSQPKVETTKANVHRIIASYHEKKELPQESPSLTTPECSVYGNLKASTPAEALKKFLIEAAEDGYVCLQVYLSPTPEIDKALHKFRAAIGDKYGFAVTMGYGPRYLHSTGQMHKGDSGKGSFIQLTADDALDIEIPACIGAAHSTLTFGMLKSAQAMGDRQALLDLGRKFIRFHWKTNVAAGVNTLAEIL